MDAATAERLVANEHRFREVNERLEEGVRPLIEAGELVPFVCECSSVACRDSVELGLDEYRALRATDARFAVVDGHELPAIERVVQRQDRYLVVEKL